MVGGGFSEYYSKGCGTEVANARACRKDAAGSSGGGRRCRRPWNRSLGIGHPAMNGNGPIVEIETIQIGSNLSFSEGVNFSRVRLSVPHWTIRTIGYPA
jgi:hypothetical protein